jgi:hypothetical protein
MRDEGVDFMDWLVNEFNGLLMQKFGLTEDDFQMMSTLWA